MNAIKESNYPIEYSTSLTGVTAEHLAGFFVGWPNPPSPETHLRILQGSQSFVLSIEPSSGRVVGFVTALSDGVLAAYLPLLEVLPEYQGRGIGAELVRRVLDQLGGLYMVDLVCDPHLEPFYQKLGMSRSFGMMLRSYDRQSGV